MKKMPPSIARPAEFIFGVTFYPELWPQAYVKTAFSEIAEVGFNVVRFGEMAWGTVEKANGVFDFSVFDQAFDLAARHNLKILFGIGTASAPQWAIKKYPEIRPMDQRGILSPEYGPRPNICRDSDTYFGLAKKYIQAVVSHYRRHPALFGWQIDNEPCYPPLDSTENFDFCHCPHTQQKFIYWAKESYATIENLNAEWGTVFWGGQFSNFDEISIPKCGFWEAGNPHIYLDWYRFKSIRLNEILRALSNEIKRIDSQHTVGTNNFIGLVNRVPDNAVLAGGMDWYGWDFYPKGTDNSVESFAENADLWRGICEANQARFIVAEMQGGENVRWGNPAPVNGNDLISWTHQAVAHGAQGILYHAYRAALVGSETGGFGILNQDGSKSSRLQAIKQISREIKDNYNALSDYALHCDVAIAFLKSSEIETYQEEGPTRAVPAHWFSGRGELGLFHSLNSVAGAYRICFGEGRAARFIFEKQIEENEINEKVLLLPNPYVLSKKAFENILKFVQNGGLLITESRFGAKDQHAHLREKALSEQLLGAGLGQREILSAPTKFDKFGAQATGFREKFDEKGLKAGGAKILAKFVDGQTALIEKKIGKGKVIYAFYSLFQSLIAWENRRLLAFIKKQLPAAKFIVKGSRTVECVQWVAKKASGMERKNESADQALYLINHRDQTEKIQISQRGREKKITMQLKARAARLVKINKEGWTDQ